MNRIKTHPIILLLYYFAVYVALPIFTIVSVVIIIILSKLYIDTISAVNDYKTIHLSNNEQIVVQATYANVKYNSIPDDYKDYVFDFTTGKAWLFTGSVNNLIPPLSEDIDNGNTFFLSPNNKFYVKYGAIYKSTGYRFLRSPCNYDDFYWTLDGKYVISVSRREQAVLFL